MKYRLANLLRCPGCGADLELTILREETVDRTTRYFDASICRPGCHCVSPAERAECAKKEITDGLLRCATCETLYPVVRGVPRLLADSLTRFPDFVRNWAGVLRAKHRIALPTDTSSYKLEGDYGQVATHFGTQWSTFGREKKSFGKSAEQCREYLEWSMMPPDSHIADFTGGRILDAGCGHGKYILALQSEQAEIVGFDLTDSVDLCQELVGKSNNVHVVQGDVIHPPFRPQTFDYVYSEGVIHHTPDTRRAFRSLAALAKPGALYAVWVYPFRAAWWDSLQQAIRAVTTRLPARLLLALCYIPVPLLSIPGIGAYSGTSLRNASWAECAQVVFDFYGPKYQTHHTDEEVIGWFDEEGYERMGTGPDPLSVFGFRRT